jgi:hypothetical protein
VLDFSDPAGPRYVKVKLPESQRRRHRRKYAAGELGEDKSFYFRGPSGKLNLRAQNMNLFAQLAEGLDDDTWSSRLAQADYSRWLRETIRDEDLAEVVRRRTFIPLEEDRNGQNETETMGSESEDRFDSSACRVVQEERAYDCAIAGIEKGVAEGSAIRTADADVFH